MSLTVNNKRAMGVGMALVVIGIGVMVGAGFGKSWKVGAVGGGITVAGLVPILFCAYKHAEARQLTGRFRNGRVLFGGYRKTGGICRVMPNTQYKLPIMTNESRQGTINTFNEQANSLGNKEL